VSVLALLFSVLYVLWYRSLRPADKSPGASTISVLGLFISLITSLLVPVDVFLISYMKNADGTWKPWAETEEQRETLTDTILYAYYTCYSIILVLTFLLIPSNFFYHGLSNQSGDEDDSPSVQARLCHSIKYTLLFIFLLSVLVLGGIFIPFNGLPPNNKTDWQQFQWFLEEVEVTQGHDIIVFILNVLMVVGMLILVVYTGYGTSSLPCGLIRRKAGVQSMLTGVEMQIQELEAQIKNIQQRYEGASLPGFEETHIERLEQQVRLLRRERRDLDQRARTMLNRCKLIFRPFQVVAGVIFSIFGFLVFISLLLSNIDKAMNSEGPKTGYTLLNSSLPNPLDFLLVFAQNVFPLDYILYITLILFLLSCSMSGISSVGIRFFWITIYKIRAWRTPPRGLLMSVALLMLIILAQNIILFYLLPDYTTFGSQPYQVVRNNISHVERCGDNYWPSEHSECVPSRISVLLLAFHAKAWIFGATFFWLTWVFICAVIVGSVVSIFKLRTLAESDEEGLIDSDDE